MDFRRRHLEEGLTPAKPSSVIPSSSPAFATPIHPIRQPAAAPPAAAPTHDDGEATATATTTTTLRPAPSTAAAVLPIEVPIVKFRPLAVRVFTKRHNLNLTSQALQALATFVGRHCGTGWLTDGLAEKVLEEVAKRWKKNGGAFIVEGDSKELQAMLKELASCMVGGKIVANAGKGALSRETSFGMSAMEISDTLTGSGANPDVGMGEGQERGEDEVTSMDPRTYMKVISAFEQPRLNYNPLKRHFEKIAKPASLFPDAATRTTFVKQRYHMVHQRLMRNASFQTPSKVPVRRTAMLQRAASSFLAQQAYKLSNITDLLGRHGTPHLLLGLLSVAPAGHYAISDLTGSIMLDLSLAAPVPEGAWFVPGMMVIVDGTYEEEGVNGTTMVGSNTGIGGTIGGRFIVSTIAGPPSERREKTLGIVETKEKDHDDFAGASGFGWVDFLGIGSEKALGAKMRRVEGQVLKKSDIGGRGRIVVIGELNLDVPETLEALRKILNTYESEAPGSTPMTFILTGNFVSTAGMARHGSAGSIEYKEHFDVLASILSEYPRVLAAATFVFVPGANDPWAASFSASATTTIPQQALPATLTSRIRRAFTTSNAEKEKTKESSLDGEVIFTSNPARISLFGTAQEVVVLRDDIVGRTRRHAVTFAADLKEDDEDDEDELTAFGKDNGTSTPEAMDLDPDPQVLASESHQPSLPQPATAAANNTTSSSTQSATALSPEDIRAARKLVKLIIDQAYLAPFSTLIRPTLWDYAPCLHMTPLPTAMVLVDPEAPPFAIGYEGCFVINPGRCLVENRKGLARWAEFDTVTRRGKGMGVSF